MTILLAASLLLSPVSTDPVTVGAAQYYGAWYDHGGWEQIVSFRKDWGQLPDDFALGEGEYYCAHPDYDFGTRLRIENATTGTVIYCRVVDTVAPADVARWRENAVIELSYQGWIAVDARTENRVIVTREGGDG